MHGPNVLIYDYGSQPRTRKIQTFHSPLQGNHSVVSEFLLISRIPGLVNTIVRLEKPLSYYLITTFPDHIIIL